MIFLFVICPMPLLDLLFWWWADRRLRPLRRHVLWRSALATFMGAQLALFAWIFASRWTKLDIDIPPWVLALLYLWHILILPTTMILLTAGKLLVAAVTLGRWIVRCRPTPAVSSEPSALQPADPPSGPSRRQLLLGAAAAIPPLIAIGSAGGAVAALGRFRVQQLTVHLPDLPAALDGLTIAHVSDIHVGRFTNTAMLDAIIQRTNEMDADLVLMTGDLIDFAIKDLPSGIDTIKQLSGRYGLFMCEGNHDLFQNRLAFEEKVRDAGIPLLLGEERTVSVRGHRLQILGIEWGDHRDEQIARQVENVLSLRKADAFPILLAHHPHAFDPAAAAGIPLTLAGHTHGGQVMLTRNFGPGPLMYRYWSGLYHRGRSSLVVSNGVGNWFPLRINAPAELVRITLRSGHNSAAPRQETAEAD